MTPLERAARVLARRSCPPGGEAQFPYVSADEWEAKNWRDHIAAARAVLMAVREPSEGMVASARASGDPYERYGREPAEIEWQAMIDAALAD